MKAAPIIGKIDEMIFHRDLPDVPFLKEAKESGIGGVLTGEFNGSRADVDPDHVKAALYKEHGIVSWSRPNIQGLTHRDRTVLDEPNEVRVRAPGVPRQGGRGGLQIDVFPILGVRRHKRILAFLFRL